MVLSRTQSDQQHLVDGLETSLFHHVQTVGSLTPHLGPSQQRGNSRSHIIVHGGETRRLLVSNVQSLYTFNAIYIMDFTMESTEYVE